ncbi:MAG: ABC transporter permease, partial [Actinomycetota bacterium]|nr:ABC transporter permease [Actinomycetota bacterium]
MITDNDLGAAMGGREGDDDLLSQELSGLDHLTLAVPPAPSRGRRAWEGAWPKVAALVLALAIWQLLVWSGWKPTFVFPGPGAVFGALWRDRSAVVSGAVITLRRAVFYYLLALLTGTVVALGITRLQVLRRAVSPLLAGLQTMPSVAWVPFAILIFGLSSRAILFVTILGAAPAITVGTLSGIDAIPPALLRVGEVLGAKGFGRYRHVIAPAALPGYVTGMKQGWAFAWRSLLAGELITRVKGNPSLGQLLSSYRNQSQVQATNLM